MCERRPASSIRRSRAPRKRWRARCESCERNRLSPRKASPLVAVHLNGWERSEGLAGEVSRVEPRDVALAIRSNRRPSRTREGSQRSRRSRASSPRSPRTEPDRHGPRTRNPRPGARLGRTATKTWRRVRSLGCRGPPPNGPSVSSPTVSGRALVLASPRPRSRTVCLKVCNMGMSKG